MAQLAGVSVRTLHYYDEIGLLEPSFIHDNGYRYYEEKELHKLQQILFFKELEFSLEDILQMVNFPDFDALEALKDQKRLLGLKKDRTEKMIKTIDHMIKDMEGGGAKMDTQDLFNSFNEQEIEEYKAEAKKRWGHTDAYKQSLERTKHWTKEDYKKATEDWKKFNQELADAMDKGYESVEFQSLIAKQHQSINTFYDCSFEMFRSLADMYVADSRFKKSYNKFRPGLAEFMKKAIYYYCDEHEKNIS